MRREKARAGDGNPMPERHQRQFAIFFVHSQPMKDPLRPLLHAWARLRRFRHRRGYGIHSPFAFQLVTGVIYEKGEYYAYRRLAALRKGTRTALRERDDRLLLRLINHHGADSCWVVGHHTELTCKYLQAGRARCRIRSTAEATPTLFHTWLANGDMPDMVCLIGCRDWHELLRALLPHCHDRCLVAIEGIHRHKGGRLWKEAIREEAVRVTFDLYDWGLLYFEKRLNKQDYLISY